MQQPERHRKLGHGLQPPGQHDVQRPVGWLRAAVERQADGWRQQRVQPQADHHV